MKFNKFIKENIVWLVIIGIGIFIFTGKDKSLIIKVVATPSMSDLMKYAPEDELLKNADYYNEIDLIYFNSKLLYYQIYYKWDNKIDSDPFWSIQKSPDNNWYVTEWANGRNSNAMYEELKYYPEWYNEKSLYIDRSRGEMIRHMLSGSSGNKEEEVCE